jgi:CreA protein
VAGVTRYVSRAKTGGIKGGWPAEDKAAVDRLPPDWFDHFALPLKGRDVHERISLVFKRLQVVRTGRQTQHRVPSHTGKVIEGSPQTA